MYSYKAMNGVNAREHEKKRERRPLEEGDWIMYTDAVSAQALDERRCPANH